MPVNVEFPDGSVRKMPSHKERLPDSREIGPRKAPMFIDVPDYDPDWRFETALGGKWFANPRH